MIFGTGNNLTRLTINFITQSIQVSVLIPDLDLSQKKFIKKNTLYLKPRASFPLQIKHRVAAARPAAPTVSPILQRHVCVVLRDKTVGNPTRVRFQADRREQRYYDGSSRELHTLLALLLYSSTELKLPGETGLRRML